MKPKPGQKTDDATAKSGPRWLSVVLVGLWVACFLGLPATAKAGENARHMTPAEAHDAEERGELVIIDVRAPEEWRQTGLPKDALAITMHDTAGTEAFYNRVMDAVDGNKERAVAFICATGIRSHVVANFFMRRGFSNAYDVVGGLMGGRGKAGWISSGLPLSPWTGTTAHVRP